MKNAALAVGSLSPPETIANDPIRAHALEGRLFRTVLETDLGTALSDLGRFAGRPKDDHELAAAAAWMQLS